MDRIAIEFITALGQNPVEFVHLASDLGVPRTGIALSPIVVVPDDAPRWSMREDAALHAAVKAALAERGVAAVLGEGFLIHPQMEIADSARDMDLLADLGAERVNIVAIEPDTTRCHDQFGTFADMAGARGMKATIEFLPGVPVGDLSTALDCVRASGRANAGVLIDSMHFFRSGGTIAELEAVDPALIGHAQLCDLPEIFAYEAYADQAKFERLAPGEGGLPLREFIKALPQTLLLGLEIPQRAKALAGMDHHERIAAIVEATRSFTTGLL